VPDAPLPDAADVMVALHARRSHPAVARWRERHRNALVVALTGTDLYRDVPEGDADALASLAAADRLVVLQQDALAAVPAAYRGKVDVVYQSAPTLERWTRKSASRLSCVFVAHLRPEKDPRTVLEAWRRLPKHAPITLSIVGEALDKTLAAEVIAAAAEDTRIQWLGPRSHAWTRQAIRRAHVLVCASRLEGGANVVAEAITAGTAVVASRMSGNLGMLGHDYAGYFDVGDGAALADRLQRCREEPGFLDVLERQGAARAPLFLPGAERSALRAVLQRAVAKAC